MSVAELRASFEEQKIKNIALVDDVFDVPSPDRLDPIHYSEYRLRYNSEESLQHAVRRVSGGNLPRLPRFDDLCDEDVGPLWKCVWKTRLRLGGRRLDADHIEALRKLFVHADDPLDMLETVVELVALFRGDLRTTVTVHGTDFDVDQVAKAQIVVIDYFLGNSFTTEMALAKAAQVVADVVNAARSAHRTVPSFLLVSSRPQDIDIEMFCRRAKLMKSRFRFFSKDALRADRVADMVNLHDLVEAYNHTERIERLIEDWHTGARAAIGEIRERMLTLDVSDFVYLDSFRLTHEGTSIGNYLRWFLTALLSASIAGHLNKGLWHRADRLAPSWVVDENGALDPKALIGTFEGPSHSIADAYGDILFDETRGTGDRAFPARLAAEDLVEGDLFVRPKGKDRKGYDGAEVRLVMTPTCDLIRREPHRQPTLRNVLLLPGTLNAVAQEDSGRNFTKIDFVRVQERGKWRVLHIVWDFARPLSVEWTKMCDEGAGKAFRRLGRLRGLYFHRVREGFANRLTRIGTEVAPLFPHPRSGDVFIAVASQGRRTFKGVMPFLASEGLVWEIGPVRVTTSDRADKYMYQASRRFLNRLTDVLDDLPHEPPELAESVERVVTRLRDMQTYMAFLKPTVSGKGGASSVVEFCKARKRSDVNPSGLRSNSEVLIVTFID